MKDERRSHSSQDKIVDSIGYKNKLGEDDGVNVTSYYRHTHISASFLRAPINVTF